MSLIFNGVIYNISTTESCMLHASAGFQRANTHMSLTLKWKQQDTKLESQSLVNLFLSQNAAAGHTPLCLMLMEIETSVAAGICLFG